MTIHIQEELRALLNLPTLPCEEAADWAQGKTIQEIWNTCERGDWLLWWAQKRGLESRKLTAAYAAVTAAYAAAYGAKRSEILQKYADEVRRIVTLQDLGY